MKFNSCAQLANLVRLWYGAAWSRSKCK